MHLATLDDTPDGSPAARLDSGEFLHLRRAARQSTLETWLPDTLVGILGGGEAGLSIVRNLIDSIESLPEPSRDALRANGSLLPCDTRLLAPIPRPGLILAAGLAYRSHLAEMSGTPVPAHPTAFMKSADSIAAPGRVLVLPRQAAEHVDFEGELALVFGRVCHNVSSETAMDHIAGFTIANDVSARDWVRAVWQATEPWDARRTWEVNLMGKQLPGFTPLGPVITTRDEIQDVPSLRLTTRLNGQVMQDAALSDMIFDLADVVAYFSRWYRFQPGDILLTGTPAGVGVGRKPPVFLGSGDRVDVTVSTIGTLSSTFQNAPV